MHSEQRMHNYTVYKRHVVDDDDDDDDGFFYLFYMKFDTNFD